MTPIITPEMFEALRDLRVGVDLDRHHLPNAELRLAALDAAIELLPRYEKLRSALELIANQGPNFGPDGTFRSWRHWSTIASEALASSPTQPPE
ncbi:hypothetical protein NB700_001893 [Xanthomonas sacchari]|uniref:Uncharacterized protein n=1 Tax=Xanthomonas sacchari TaxID=56458 RepID=A0ABT3DVB4_9XANT|nr:hypothetical protein [Xanthomonas sacchari]MCW0399337.1 hypothetical protein [Xanthomonas sacchari]